MEGSNIEDVYGEGFLDKFRGGNDGVGSQSSHQQPNVPDPDFLYGDLDVTYEGHELRRAKSKCKFLERKCEALNFENQRLSDLLDKSNADKTTLERNISILYKTAKENIERLQKQNTELQNQLLRNSGGR